MDTELTREEIDELATWMQSHVKVNIASGLTQEEVTVGILDPDVLRSLSPTELTELETGDKLYLQGLVSSWKRWRDEDIEPDRIIYTANLGTSPWRTERRENPPQVSDVRDDLVWMEWSPQSTGQFHKARSTATSIPVVGGAGQAVLTNETRARSLNTYPCPDCFPDADSPYASIRDTETGQRITINTDEIESVPKEVRDEFSKTVQNLETEKDSE